MPDALQDGLSAATASNEGSFTRYRGMGSVLVDCQASRMTFFANRYSIRSAGGSALPASPIPANAGNGEPALLLRGQVRA
jgi:hypothetical protein